MGVINVLQLIRFFTTPGNEPKKGIVALLNNGEEDFLNGKVGSRHISYKDLTADRCQSVHTASNFPVCIHFLESGGSWGRRKSNAIPKH